MCIELLDGYKSQKTDIIHDTAHTVCNLTNMHGAAWIASDWCIQRAHVVQIEPQKPLHIQLRPRSSNHLYIRAKNRLALDSCMQKSHCDEHDDACGFLH